MKKILLFSLLLITCFPSIFGKDGNIFIGVVIDNNTGERLGLAKVDSKFFKKPVITDKDGVFKFNSTSDSLEISISYSGFAPVNKFIKPNHGDTTKIIMSERINTLSEIVVRPKKEKYSKKNNPAIDLLRDIRENSKNTDPENNHFYSYDIYEKILLALNDFEMLKDEGKFQNKMSFLNDYIDTADWTGKQIVDLSLKEKLSTRIHSDKPAVKKEIIKGYISHGIDKSFNEENIRKILEDVLREINIYSNDIAIMQNRFVSPLSVIGEDYYKYYLKDTVTVGGDRCVELSFVPHTPESFGFNGSLYVSVNDSARHIKRVFMRVPKDINLNYVKNIFISQNFEIDSLGNRHKTTDDLCLELQLIPGTQEFYASRKSRYSNFSYLKSDELANFLSVSGNEIDISSEISTTDDIWENGRKVNLTKAERQMGHFMSRFRKVPFLYWSEKVLAVLFKGYIKTSAKSKFDFGPINTFISYNKAEGLRLRIGGMTTANLSSRIFGRYYLAYGFGDKKFKYSAEMEYSFWDKKYHSYEFPMNGIRLSHSFDTDQLGQHYLFTNQDNIFLSLKRKESDLITYRRETRLQYNLELLNNFSFNARFKTQRQEATKFVKFILPDGKQIPYYNLSTFKITFRYAPGEKFTQQISNRLPINMDAPIFLLSHEIGAKGLMGSDFNLHKTEFSFNKRFWLSAFGYTDVILKMAKLWSQVQFPSLLWQNANLSYIIQPESYSLLNPMEFAMDEYASLDLTYWINGAIFNRIPLIKKLKMREVITFKGFMGSLSKKNNPEFNENLFRFPEIAGTRLMGKTPYMELGVGIDNLFTILRIDYIWRLTYRNLPGIDKSGLRLSLHLQF